MKSKSARFCFLILTALLVTGCTPDTRHLETARSLIDSLQNHWAPDTRVALFSVEASDQNGQLLLTGLSTDNESVIQLKSALNKHQIEFTDSILVLPDPALGEHTWGLITLSVASIRYKPSQTAEMATQALMGTPVRILRKKDDYYLIQTPDHYIAWTETASLSPKTATEMARWKSADRVIFMADFGLVYCSPNRNSNPVSDLVAGTILEIDHSKNSIGKFVAVRLPDSREGFVEAEQCRDLTIWSTQATTSGIALETTARLYMGRPYLWGGTSPKAFDCSGFTKTVYYHHGYILPRDASQQISEGILITTQYQSELLQVGDLLFFGRKATPEKPERATHVGLYLGDSYFIHCSGLVKINSLDSTNALFKQNYIDNLLQIKRFLTDSDQPQRVADHPWYF